MACIKQQQQVGVIDGIGWRIGEKQKRHFSQEFRRWLGTREKYEDSMDSCYQANFSADQMTWMLVYALGTLAVMPKGMCWKFHLLA